MQTHNLLCFRYTTNTMRRTGRVEGWWGRPQVPELSTRSVLLEDRGGRTRTYKCLLRRQVPYPFGDTPLRPGKGCLSLP